MVTWRFGRNYSEESKKRKTIQTNCARERTVLSEILSNSDNTENHQQPSNANPKRLYHRIDYFNNPLFILMD